MSGRGGKLPIHGGEHSHRGAEGKAERFPHRGSVPRSTHQPKRLVCSPTGKGGVWELRLGLQSDLRERTGVGSVNTALRGSCTTASWEGITEKSAAAEEARDFFLPLVSRCTRRGDSECRLNELQRWA